MTGNCTPKMHETQQFIESRVKKLKVLGEIKRFIGLDVIRDRHKGTLTLSQQPFCEQLIKAESTINNLKAIKVPLNPYKDYRIKGTPGEFPPLYSSIGSLRFLADRTKPQLLAACSLLAKGTINPAREHVDGVKHCLRYLVSDQASGLTFAKTDLPNKQLELFAMCDGSYIPGYDSKSQVGYSLFMNLNSGTCCARSFGSNSVDRSAMDTEVRAIDACVVELLWHRAFLAELGFPQTEPSIIWTDSESAKILSEEFKISNRSSHIVMRLNFIHQELLRGTIKLCYIDTNNQVADVLTKALPYEPFQQHADKLLHGFSNQPITAKPRKVVKAMSYKTMHKKILASRKRLKVLL